MPRVELVQKHNFSARRLYIRGNNGKVCDVMSAYRLIIAAFHLKQETLTSPLIESQDKC